MNRYNEIDITKKIMDEEILKKKQKKQIKQQEIKVSFFKTLSNLETIFMFLYILYQAVDVLTSLSKSNIVFIKHNFFNTNFIYIISLSVLFHVISAVISSIYYKKKNNQDIKYILRTLVKPILVLVLTLTLVLIRINFINKYI